MLEADLEALAVDRGEQIGTSGQPRPAVVVGQASQRLEPGREALGQLGGRGFDLVAPVMLLLAGKPKGLLSGNGGGAWITHRGDYPTGDAVTCKQTIIYPRAPGHASPASLQPGRP